MAYLTAESGSATVYYEKELSSEGMNPRRPTHGGEINSDCLELTESISASVMIIMSAERNANWVQERP